MWQELHLLNGVALTEICGEWHITIREDGKGGSQF